MEFGNPLPTARLSHLTISGTRVIANSDTITPVPFLDGDCSLRTNAPQTFGLKADPFPFSPTRFGFLIKVPGIFFIWGSVAQSQPVTDGPMDGNIKISLHEIESVVSDPFGPHSEFENGLLGATSGPQRNAFNKNDIDTDRVNPTAPAINFWVVEYLLGGIAEESHYGIRFERESGTTGDCAYVARMGAIQIGGAGFIYSTFPNGSISIGAGPNEA